MIEIILDKPFAFINNSVWASSRGRYYIDGQTLAIPQERYSYRNAEAVRNGIKKYAMKNGYGHFNADIARFIRANKKRLSYIKHEATEFIRETAAGFPAERLIVSFSAGKDSSVVADLVSKALGNPSMTYIFADTTLEFDTTLEYVRRFKESNPNAVFKTARNNEKDFFEVCKDIGVPGKKIRWCCTMFKTGPISRTLNRMFGNKTVITFNGIRANESTSRSKYERITKQCESTKIQQQIAAAPILAWYEADVWLYLLSEKLDFNEAYRLGHRRVGCWPCPNNSLKSTFLDYVYMPEQTEAWRSQLIDFAKSLGKFDPEDYVDQLYWTYRQGGKGLKSSADVRVENITCATDEYAKVYKLKTPVSSSFYSLFTPFGIVSPELGRKLIGEVLVLDPKSKIPIISIQPFQSDGYDNAVKIKTLNVKNHLALQRKIVYQIRKFNACRECGKCAGLCVSGAIKLGNRCYIDKNRCSRCQKCVTAKYIEGGCMMYKILLTKIGAAI